MVKRFCLIVIFLMLMPNVIALGIGPSSITLNYTKGMSQTISYIAINNIDQRNTVEVYASGDLAAYITCSKKILEIAAQSSAGFSCILSIPKDIDIEPGLRESRVGVIETAPTTGEGTAIGSRIAVDSLLYVYVPYPGKYISVSLQVSDVKVNEKAIFKVIIKSLGLEDTEIQGNLKILDSKNNTLKTLDIDKRIIKSMATETINMVFDSIGFISGEYSAIVAINYDSKTASTQGGFRIGELLVEITKIIGGKFKSGEIAKIKVNLKNKGQEKINDIQSELQILKEDSIVDSVRNPFFNLDAWEEKSVFMYWETSKAELGTYDVRVILKYANKTTEQIEKNAVIVAKRINIELLLTILIVILIIVFFIIFFLYRKSSKIEKKVKRKNIK